MKLSDLRPCDNCGGKIAPQFYVVRFSLALINADVANQTLGLTQMLGGSLALAEVFASGKDAVIIAGEKDKTLLDEIYLCSDCYCGDVNLAMLAEKVYDQTQQTSEKEKRGE